LLGKSARESGFAADVALGESAHSFGFVYCNSDQASAEKDALQMTGSMADLESPRPFDERDHFQNPVFPLTE